MSDRKREGESSTRTQDLFSHFISSNDVDSYSNVLFSNVVDLQQLDDLLRGKQNGIASATEEKQAG